MECPRCYDEEVEVNGFHRTINRYHLPMQYVAHDNKYKYYQCERCALIRRQSEGGLFTSGIIEDVPFSEAKELVESSSSSGFRWVGIALAGLFLAALLTDSEKE